MVVGVRRGRRGPRAVAAAAAAAQAQVRMMVMVETVVTTIVLVSKVNNYYLDKLKISIRDLIPPQSSLQRSQPHRLSRNHRVLNNIS